MIPLIIQDQIYTIHYPNIPQSSIFYFGQFIININAQEKSRLYHLF